MLRSQLGTADGANAEAAREHTSIYGRSREASAMILPKGRAGSMLSARWGLQAPARRRASAKQAAGRQRRICARGRCCRRIGAREAARLDSFIQALAARRAIRPIWRKAALKALLIARNERLGRIVEQERLPACKTAGEHGVNLSRRQIAMDQNGDLSLNLSPEGAAAMWKGGINESQLGAIANGGRARFSFAHNDLLVSSSAGFSQSARSDTSTRFEAGKQAGPDTIEHFLGDGQQGQAMMEGWLKGGFEMDRKGQWRLKPQVADTLERDVQAIIAQTGWSRSLSRSAQDQTSMGTDINASIAGRRDGGLRAGPARRVVGDSRFGWGECQRECRLPKHGSRMTSESADAKIDIVNYDVRHAIAVAERKAAQSQTPTETFTGELRNQILGKDGLRSRYLNQADAGRGTFNITAPLTSIEQSSVLKVGRFSADTGHGNRDETIIPKIIATIDLVDRGEEFLPIQSIPP
jgi:conjugal transfer mating pair stabilization protein TraG